MKKILRKALFVLMAGVIGGASWVLFSVVGFTIIKVLVPPEQILSVGLVEAGLASFLEMTLGMGMACFDSRKESDSIQQTTK